MPWTISRSSNTALPVAPPPPPPEPVEPVFETPQENESTSISSLCLASTDSPLMSPIFAKMSVAIGAPSRDCGKPEPSYSALLSKQVDEPDKDAGQRLRGWDDACT